MDTYANWKVHQIKNNFFLKEFKLDSMLNKYTLRFLNFDYTTSGFKILFGIWWKKLQDY